MLLRNIENYYLFKILASGAFGCKEYKNAASWINYLQFTKKKLISDLKSILGTAIGHRCATIVKPKSSLSFSLNIYGICSVFLLQMSTSRRNRLQMFFKISVLKSFANFTGKHLCWSLFLIKLQALDPHVTERWLQHRCFPVKFAKFLRTAFFQKHLQWLLLYFLQCAKKETFSKDLFCKFESFLLSVALRGVFRTMFRNSCPRELCKNDIIQ